MYGQEQNNNTGIWALIISSLFGIIMLVVIIWGFSALYKGYKVWSYAQDGKAELAKAEWTKKILTETAKAELENAKLKSDAEVARAKGVAEANKIIGDSLKGNEDYLRYLWINNMQEGDGKEVIYIPTEAGLPILEAGKR